MSTALCWIRRDLRLHDHVALSEALLAYDRVVSVFICDELILQPFRQRNRQDRRLQFIAESLVEIHQELHRFGGDLLIERGNPVEIIPRLMKELACDALYFNRDYSPYARNRDEAVTHSVQEMGRLVRSFRDHVLMEPHHILNQAGHPFRVFTPYSKAWFSSFSETLLQPASVVLRSQAMVPVANPVATSVESVLNFMDFEVCSNFLLGGSVAGLARLDSFSARVGEYDHTRDYWAIEGTSCLSVYIRHGCISIRDMLGMAWKQGGASSQRWMRELVWREFYQMVMWWYPETRHHPFQEKYREFQYPGLPEHWEAFVCGKTGFPIIDAAMRCLNETGWIHNRLRMVVASFLTKILLQDWRKGERYFSNKLLDYELTSNVGGWQWAAGVGCDAAPYFRIFNPYTQSETYDSKATFIRQWCPELALLSNQEIHRPKHVRPIVDYASQRRLALSLI